MGAHPWHVHRWSRLPRWRRFPSATEKDWIKLKVAVEADLTKLRKGEVRLDCPTVPEPAANQGAKLFSQKSDGTTTTKFFIGGMGDF
jgi:hypothetical protein